MSRSLLPLRIALPAIAVALSASTLEAQSLRGSPSSVNRMYRGAVNLGLYFYKTVSGVETAASKGRFVPLPGNRNYEVDNANHPYALPETKLFVERLSAQYRTACGEKLVVTGAVRPMNNQPANASDRSVHPTGMALDLRKPSGNCLKWLRATLLDLEKARLIEATEERNPAHFHVAVFTESYKRYVNAKTGKSVGAN